MGLKKDNDKLNAGDIVRSAVNTGQGNNDNTKKMKNVYLNVAHYEQMKIIAEERDLKTADLIRLSMKEFLERN